jgi:hypothetical protein
MREECALVALLEEFLTVKSAMLLEWINKPVLS